MIDRQRAAASDPLLWTRTLGSGPDMWYSLLVLFPYLAMLPFIRLWTSAIHVIV